MRIKATQTHNNALGVSTIKAARSLEQIMRFCRGAVFLGICGVVMINANAAPFRNLDFEEYDPSNRFLSGWHLFIPLGPRNPFNETNIWLGVPPGFSDGPLAFITDVARYPNQGLEGKYALELQPSTWKLSQRGDVPDDAKFLRWASLGPLPMDLKIDGASVQVDYFYGPLYPNFGAYAEANVSAFAGKNVELEFTVLGAPAKFIIPGQPYFSVVDNFEFSPVPEPSSVALLVVGLVLFWRWKFKCG